MPTSRCMRTAIARLLMRACARAPSAMLTTSTPPADEHLRGGDGLRRVEPDRRVHLDRDDERSRAIFAASALFFASGVGSHEPARSAPAPPTSRRSRARRARPSSGRVRRRARRAAIRAAAAMRLTCSGVVPQQPPTSCTPSLNMPPRVDAEVLGRRHVDHALVDPAREPGVRRREHRQPERAPSAPPPRARSSGPSEQLTPTTLAPHSFIRRAISSAGVPSAIRCASSSETRGDDRDAPARRRVDRGFDRDAELGGLAHRLDDERVDPGLDERARLLAEAPPSPSRGPRRSPRRGSSRSGRWRPTTYARPCAARARDADAGGVELRTRAWSPYFSSRSAFAPNVLVSMTCAPARR